MVSSLLRAGVDSLEHGTVITAGNLDLMGERGGAWAPTLCASGLPSAGDSDNARKRKRERSDYLAMMLPLAAHDLVTYDDDPRERPAVLHSPTAVVVRGHRIR